MLGKRRVGAALRSERGTALVEFALVAFPLFIVLFGIIDFARALNYYNDLTQLAGQGARAAAVNRDPNGGAADNKFQQQLACASSTGELRKGINVQILATPINVGDPVTIKTSYVFKFLPIVGLGSLGLSATQTERYEAASSPAYDASNDISGGAVSCP